MYTWMTDRAVFLSCLNPCSNGIACILTVNDGVSDIEKGLNPCSMESRVYFYVLVMDGKLTLS